MTVHHPSWKVARPYGNRYPAIARYHHALPRPSGFTLVEILLALALMMLVMAAAYSGMVMVQNVNVAGREEAERNQIARALERQFASDIQCLFYLPAPPPAASTSESTGELTSTDMGVGAADDPAASDSLSGSSSSAPESSDSTLEDPLASAVPRSLGVVGDATTLVLHVSKPTRMSLSSFAAPNSAPTTGSILEANLASSTSHVSDLRSISYFLAIPGGGGLPGLLGNSMKSGPALTMEDMGGIGLVRMDGDRLQMEQADATMGGDSFSQQSRLLAPEVTELQFRYFDGAAWLTEWDSELQDALPRCIEITLRIEIGDNNQEDDSLLNTLASLNTTLTSTDTRGLIRFVVAIPTADPALGMAL